MGLFSRNTVASKTPWNQLESIDQLNEVLKSAHEKPILIFKHSTRCGISSMAIKSFENQIYKNCELIIVADGCNKTQQIYNREFKSNPNIRFVYLDRDRQEEPATYETIEYSEQHFNVWRGEARAFGVTAASGSVITYMDSDDYLTPQFTQNLLLMYNASKDKQWWLNKSWYENQASSFNAEDGYKTDMASQPTIKFDYLPSLWKEAIIEKSTDMPWLFAHKADCTSVKWRDTFGRVNEHADFVQRFIEKYNKLL